MRDRFFLDTNIFIYATTDDDAEKTRRADLLIRQALNLGSGVISFQVVQEFFCVALKRCVRTMDLADRESYLGVVLRPLQKVHSSLMLYSDALAFQGRYQLGWYDSLIVCAALQAQCSILYSEDMQHGQRFGTLQIQNPFL
jgi:predicted nucleic acid-binding protein